MINRGRRLRRDENIRALVRETTLYQMILFYLFLLLKVKI